jgi:hypothetical protein
LPASVTGTTLSVCRRSGIHNPDPHAASATLPDRGFTCTPAPSNSNRREASARLLSSHQPAAPLPLMIVLQLCILVLGLAGHNKSTPSPWLPRGTSLGSLGRRSLYRKRSTKRSTQLRHFAKNSAALISRGPIVWVVGRGAKNRASNTRDSPRTPHEFAIGPVVSRESGPRPQTRVPFRSAKVRPFHPLFPRSLGCCLPLRFG